MSKSSDDGSKLVMHRRRSAGICNSHDTVTFQGLLIMDQRFSRMIFLIGRLLSSTGARKLTFHMGMNMLTSNQNIEEQMSSGPSRSTYFKHFLKVISCRTCSAYDRKLLFHLRIYCFGCMWNK